MTNELDAVEALLEQALQDAANYIGAHRRTHSTPPPSPVTGSAAVEATLQVVNASANITPGEATDTALALDAFFRNHVNPAWGISWGAVLVTAQAVDKSQPWVLLQDQLQGVPTGVLGYHTTDAQGHSIAYVGVQACQQAGVSLASCAGHEAAELACDPWTDYLVTDGQSKVVMLEVGDPVESDVLPVVVTRPDGSQFTAQMTNFVLPSWFDPQDTVGPWDAMKTTPGPLQLAKGGYCVQGPYDPSTLTQVFADGQQPTSARWRAEHDID